MQPKYVTLNGAALRYREVENDYFRDSGHWSVTHRWEDGRLLSVSSDPQMNGHVLSETTRQKWIDQNHADISSEYKTTDKLLAAMKKFQLDDPDSALKFSARLARENGWSREYALRVVEEYKRFVMMCCIVPGGATPSDAVDQAWHLHMIYTRSYWDEMCDDILSMKLHHGPTKGGGKESKKFDGMYTRTLDAYRETFKEEPPKDIWPPNDIRFSDIDFQRVNRRTNWVIPKPSAIWGTVTAMIAVILLALVNVQASGLTTGEWICIGAAVLVVIIIILLIRNNRGGRGGRGGGGCGGDSSWIPFVSSGCSSSSSKSSSSGCSSHSSGCGSSGCGSSCGSSCGGGCSGCGS